MRFRIKHGGPAAQLRFDRTEKPLPKRETEKTASLVEKLDNPYSRYYGSPRSREDLRRHD